MVTIQHSKLAHGEFLLGRGQNENCCFWWRNLDSTVYWNEFSLTLPEGDSLSV